MCTPSDTAVTSAKPNSATAETSTCFSCTRLNPTTFVVVEDDKYREMPFIYVKVYESVLVVIDTGCGGAASDPDVKLTSLRRFLETYPVEDNHGHALNGGGTRGYVVICTHCHYDHIGGVAQFTDTPRSAIWASSYSRGFIEDDLPTTSLCRFVGMETPEYKVTDWAADGQRVTYDKQDLGLTVYHTPGHTPDELAVWDPRERVLFVGDSLYEWAPIIFPLAAGNLQEYTATLYKLKTLLKGWNEGVEKENRVKIACGHITCPGTSDVDAQEFVEDVERFLSKVKRGLVEAIDKGEARGQKMVQYEQEGGRISFLGPKRTFDEFQANVCPI